MQVEIEKICKSCGYDNPGEAKFCRQCGRLVQLLRGYDDSAGLPEADSAPPSSTNEAKRTLVAGDSIGYRVGAAWAGLARSVKVGLVGSGVLAVILILVYAFQNSTNNDTNYPKSYDEAVARGMGAPTAALAPAIQPPSSVREDLISDLFRAAALVLPAK